MYMYGKFGIKCVGVGFILLGWVFVLPSVALAQGFVSYEQFGAVGDGTADDRAAIVKAHAAANEKGVSVRATGGKTY